MLSFSTKENIKIGYRHTLCGTCCWVLKHCLIARNAPKFILVVSPSCRWSGVELTLATP